MNNPPTPRRQVILAAFTLLICAFALFFELGHYALWDDEASTALHAEGILATGDTSAVIGHNIYAYRGGVVLKNLCDRVTPPLGSYLTAPMIALFGTGTAAVRFPFALSGLCTVVLLLWWLHKDKASGLTWGLTCMAIVGNVSFFLYCRQCRYYGPSIFTAAALAYLYFHWRGTVWQRVLWGVASLALLASNYMTVIMVYVCLALDYVFFGRKRLRFSVADFCWILIPQILLGGAIVAIWNPLATAFAATRHSIGLSEKLTLLWWNLRDTDTCEFYVGGLLLVAVYVAWRRKDEWLRRGLFAFGVFIIGTTLLSPQTTAETSLADVRYCVAVIPLGIFLGARVLALLGAKAPEAFIIVGCAAFFTNLLQGGPLLFTGFHCTPELYLQELALRPPDPYTVTAKWINANVKEGKSILALPDYTRGPLMYHAPKAIYAWQLDIPPKPQFQGLPAIDFKYREEPDYVIAFGPAIGEAQQELARRENPRSRYIPLAVLPCYSKDCYRPELFWRNFGVTPLDDGLWGIQIFKRVPSIPGSLRGY